MTICPRLAQALNDLGSDVDIVFVQIECAPLNQGIPYGNGQFLVPCDDHYHVATLGDCPGGCLVSDPSTIISALTA